MDGTIDPERRRGNTQLQGRPLDDDGKVELRIQVLGRGAGKTISQLHQAVWFEIDRTIAAYGAFPIDPLRAAAILTEEAAEVLGEALKLTNPNSRASHQKAKGTTAAARYELVQVIAAATQMYLNLVAAEQAANIQTAGANDAND